MAQRLGVSIIDLIVALPETMLQKFGLIYTTMFPDLPLEMVAIDMTSWNVLSVVVGTSGMMHGTAARLRNTPIGSHFAQPVHMGRAIESGMLHWLSRSSRKYRVPPNMETFAEVQFKVGPQARKASTCNAAIYKRLVEVHQEFANVGGFIMPSLAELITGGWSPFMKPSNDLTHMNTPKVDNLGMSYPACLTGNIGSGPALITSF